MAQRSVTHATFVIERVYDATPARVFAAWASVEAKSCWFVGPADWERGVHELDFRVGGRERLSGGAPGEKPHSYDALYQDIVPDRRIVLSYDMHIGETRISVSLMTVEVLPEGSFTRLILTEQDAFLDGYDDAGSRERGTQGLLDQLGRALEQG